MSANRNFRPNQEDEVLTDQPATNSDKDSTHLSDSPHKHTNVHQGVHGGKDLYNLFYLSAKYLAEIGKASLDVIPLAKPILVGLVAIYDAATSWREKDAKLTIGYGLTVTGLALGALFVAAIPLIASAALIGVIKENVLPFWDSHKKLTNAEKELDALQTDLDSMKKNLTDMETLLQDPTKKTAELETAYINSKNEFDKKSQIVAVKLEKINKISQEHKENTVKLATGVLSAVGGVLCFIFPPVGLALLAVATAVAIGQKIWSWARNKSEKSENAKSIVKSDIDKEKTNTDDHATELSRTLSHDPTKKFSNTVVAPQPAKTSSTGLVFKKNDPIFNPAPTPNNLNEKKKDGDLSHIGVVAPLVENNNATKISSASEHFIKANRISQNHLKENQNQSRANIIKNPGVSFEVSRTTLPPDKKNVIKEKAVNTPVPRK